MLRTTVDLPDELHQAMEAFLKDQSEPPTMTAMIQDALRLYLQARGYPPPAQPLKITPALQGSGRQDISLNHDRYLAER